MILPAAGAIFLDLEAIYKGKYLEFGPPQARKILSDFLADRPNILFIPPSVSKSGGARGGINTRTSPDDVIW